MPSLKIYFHNKGIKAFAGAVLLTCQVCLIYLILMGLKLDHYIWGRFEGSNGFSLLFIVTGIFTFPLGAGLGLIFNGSRIYRIGGGSVIAALALVLLCRSFLWWNRMDTFFVFVPICGLVMLWAALLMLRCWHSVRHGVIVFFVSLFLMSSLTAYLLFPYRADKSPANLRLLHSVLRFE